MIPRLFEAAAIIGVKLFDVDDVGLSALSDRMDDRIALLPKHIYKAGKRVKDEF